MNGDLILSNYLGQTASDHATLVGAYWGRISGASSDPRTTEWASVEFATIPEPSSTAMVIMVGGALALSRLRR